MGFFDFLSAPAQDPTLQNQGQGGKKLKILANKKGLTQEGSDFFSGNPPEGFSPPEQQDDQSFQAEETAGKGMKPAENPTTGKMDQLARQISKLAAEIQYGASGDLEKQEGLQKTLPQGSGANLWRSPHLDTLGPPVERASLEGAFFQDPENAAQRLVDSAAIKDRVKSDPRMKRLNALIVEYKQTARTGGGQEYMSGVTGPVGDEDVASAVGFMEQLSERKATLQRMLPDAASSAHAEEINKQIRDIEIAEKAGAQKLTKLQAAQRHQQGGQSEPAAPPPPPVDGKLPPEADIKKNHAGSGHTDEQLVLAILASMKKAEKDGGLELGDLMRDVPFDVAFRTMLPILDPQGKVTSELVSLYMKSKQPQQGAPGPQGKPPTAGPTGPSESDESLMELKALQKQRRDLIVGLGKDPASHNWLSAIVTILLSAVIGSEKALRVMGYASQTNTLKLQMDILNQEIMETASLHREQRRAESEMRRDAARNLQRKEDRGEEWRFQYGMQLLRHNQILERMSKKGDPNSEMAKKLIQSFRAAGTMVDKFQKTANNPYAPEAKQIDAQKNVDVLMRRMAELYEDIDGLGGYTMEEEAEEE